MEVRNRPQNLGFGNLIVRYSYADSIANIIMGCKLRDINGFENDVFSRELPNGKVGRVMNVMFDPDKTKQEQLQIARELRKLGKSIKAIYVEPDNRANILNKMNKMAEKMFGTGRYFKD